MSSRELLVFVDQLPDDSNTKTALRDGDWSFKQYLDARLVNELMYMRADGTTMRPQPILSPHQALQKAIEQQQRIDAHALITSQIFGDFVPPTREVAFEHADGPPEKTRHWTEGVS